MIAAVVLSAGESSRMGRPKALLPIEGETFIGRIVASLKHTQVGKIHRRSGSQCRPVSRRDWTAAGRNSHQSKLPAGSIVVAASRGAELAARLRTATACSFISSTIPTLTRAWSTG